jgi:adenylate cyclase
MPHSDARCRRLLKIRPYGMDTPVTVEQLLPPVEEYPKITDDHIAVYEQALDSFLEGEWSKALELLDSLPVYHREKDFLMTEIALRGYDAPADWNGIVEMSHK